MTDIYRPLCVLVEALEAEAKRQLDRRARLEDRIVDGVLDRLDRGSAMDVWDGRFTIMTMAGPVVVVSDPDCPVDEFRFDHERLAKR